MYLQQSSLFFSSLAYLSELNVASSLLCIQYREKLGEGDDGFHTGQPLKSTTYQLFALRQMLEKGNENNTQTHHFFKDFKAAYDTIIRNEVYVSMSELSFLTELIRLTSARLIIQNDCSEYFETRQGLR
jgi:hypothetical protein